MIDMTNTAQRPYLSDGSATNSYGVGWQLLKSAFWPMMGITIIYLILDLPFSFNQDHEGFNRTDGLEMIYDIFFYGPLGFSMCWVFLKAARRETYTFPDLFAVFGRNYWSAVGGYILQALIIIVGFFLFIIPGIIFAIRLSFVQYLIIDRKMGPTEAIKESWRLTKGYGWTLFFMGLLAIPIAILGLICLGVGIIPAIAWMYCAGAVFYHTVTYHNTTDNIEDAKFQTLE